MGVVVFQDDFYAANGSAWRSDLWTTSSVAGSPTLDIQSNAGRLLTGAAAGNDTARAISLMPKVFDCEFIGRIGVANPIASQSVGVMLRASGDWAANTVNSTTCYYAEMQPTSNNYQLYSVTGGTQTSLQTISHTFVAGTSVWMRFRLEHGRNSVKIWNDGTGEPSPWDYETNDFNVSGAGVMQVSCANNGGGAARTSTWEHITVTSLSSPRLRRRGR